MTLKANSYCLLLKTDLRVTVLGCGGRSSPESLLLLPLLATVTVLVPGSDGQTTCKHMSPHRLYLCLTQQPPN